MIFGIKLRLGFYGHITGLVNMAVAAFRKYPMFKLSNTIDLILSFLHNMAGDQVIVQAMLDCDILVAAKDFMCSYSVEDTTKRACGAFLRVLLRNGQQLSNARVVC